MSAQKSEVVSWLRENGWRYKRAASHFGLPYDQVRGWGREAKGSGKASRAPVREGPGLVSLPKPEDRPVDMSTVEYLEMALESLHAVIKKMEDAPRIDAQGISATWRIVMKARKDLDVARAMATEAGADIDPDDPEAIIAVLVQLTPELLQEALKRMW